MPPAQFLNLDVQAISGICGSISIACWVVVFSPQIIQNFQRGSADALSIQFIIVWLAGDIFNIIGAVLQHVLPTMVILAVYYTLADIVLLAQCFYYRGFTWKDPDPEHDTPPPPASRPNERTALLPGSDEHEHHDWTNLSPAVPLVSDASSQIPPRPLTTLQTVVWNTSIIAMVCAAGALGWLLGPKPPDRHHRHHDLVSFSVPGQVFGYLCAVAYIGSRLPQLILNYRRRSTDGLSMLFFLFACLGNVMYVLSILVYVPPCSHRASCAPGEAAAEYGRYVLVNLSWLLGSSLTLLLDLCVFAQYFIYSAADEDGGQHDDCDHAAPARLRSEDEIETIEPYDGSSSSEGEDEDEDEEEPARRVRPLLKRGDSAH